MAPRAPRAGRVVVRGEPPAHAAEDAADGAGAHPDAPLETLPAEADEPAAGVGEARVVVVPAGLGTLEALEPHGGGSAVVAEGAGARHGAVRGSWPRAGGAAVADAGGEAMGFGGDAAGRLRPDGQRAVYFGFDAGGAAGG